MRSLQKQMKSNPHIPNEENKMEHIDICSPILCSITLTFRSDTFWISSIKAIENYAPRKRDKPKLCTNSRLLYYPTTVKVEKWAVLEAHLV